MEVRVVCQNSACEQLRFMMIVTAEEWLLVNEDCLMQDNTSTNTTLLCLVVEILYHKLSFFEDTEVIRLIN